MGEFLEEMSKNIFTLSGQVDNYEASLIIIEIVISECLRLAIMNRLIRASSNNFLGLE